MPEDNAAVDSTENNANADVANRLAQNETQLKELAETNKQLASLLKSTSQKIDDTISTRTKKDTADAGDVNLGSLIFDDPDKALSIMTEKITQGVMGAVHQTKDIESKRTMVINELYGDYPELSNPKDPLTKKALEHFQSMSKSEQAHPMSSKIAVYDAAKELGILPKNARKDDGDDDMGNKDDFSLSNAHNKRKTKKENEGGGGELDPKTVEFARLIGLDVNDKKVIENMKKHTKRDSWFKYR